MLTIENLHVEIESKKIIKGLNLSIQPGQTHAIMGPNGAGKSTLAKVIAGDSHYDIVEGQVIFEGQNITELEPEERACLGIFMGFQYPIEIPGVTNEQFLKASLDSIYQYRGWQKLSEESFQKLLLEKMKLVHMHANFKERNVNEGFSGGEKKRNEILQMALLDPKIAILDETDSGLDIDAMRTVAHGVREVISSEKSLILITHYQRLLDYIKPDYVHVMIEGKIVESGNYELALKLEKQGYDWLIKS